ncbi:inhibitor of apoptosis-promoting Bax1 [Diplonema papillatum]|nr:inhibitor of apoptosis-promoting Bax1 [Diplonema papillatum]
MLRSATVLNRLMVARGPLFVRAGMKGGMWNAAAPSQVRAFSFSGPKLARINKNNDISNVEEASTPTQERVSEFDALTPHARTYLSRVYANSAAGVATMAAGCSVMMFTPLGMSVPFWAPMVASIVPLVALSMGYGKTQGTKLAMFHSFAGLTGMGLAPIVAFAKFGGVLVPALGLTGATFAGFTSAALLAPKGSSIKMQGPLFAGLIGLVGMQIFNIFWPTPLFTQLSMYGGLALFSLMVAADTGAMIEKANAGINDVVGDSINVVLNLVNIFTRMVQILSGRDN